MSVTATRNIFKVQNFVKRRDFILNLNEELDKIFIKIKSKNEPGVMVSL